MLAADGVAILAVAGVVRLLKAAVITEKTPVEVAAATTAVAHAHPTLASHGKTRVTATAEVHRVAISAGRKPRVRQETSSHASRVMKCSAKTHAAPVLTWATNATTLTSVNRPAMCQRDSPHPACPRAAAVVVAEAAIVAVVVAAAAALAIAAAGPVTGVVAHDRAAVAEVTRAADFNADRVAKYFPKKASGFFLLCKLKTLCSAILTVLFGDCLDRQTGPTGHVQKARGLFGQGTSQRLHPRVHQLHFARKFA